MAENIASPEPQVTHVPERTRYEIRADGTTAGFTAYVEDGARRIFYHTEIAERFAGRGLAGKLVATALTDTRTAGRRVVPVCPFVAAYVKKHHDYDDIVDPVTPEAQETVRRALGG